jgi:hypothetical protein
MPMRAMTRNAFMSGVGTERESAVGFLRQCIGPTARLGRIGVRGWRKGCRHAMGDAGPRKVL